jgi:hypothetical protein
MYLHVHGARTLGHVFVWSGLHVILEICVTVSRWSDSRSWRVQYRYLHVGQLCMGQARETRVIRSWGHVLAEVNWHVFNCPVLATVDRHVFLDKFCNKTSIFMESLLVRDYQLHSVLVKILQAQSTKIMLKKNKAQQERLQCYICLMRIWHIMFIINVHLYHIRTLYTDLLSSPKESVYS